MALMSAVASSALCAGGAEQQQQKTTFEYRDEFKTYEELTNAIPETRQRLVMAEREFGSSSTNVAEVLNELAGLYDDLGDYAGAIALQERCLSIRERLLGPQHMDVADGLNDLAWEYEQIGDNQRALLLFQRSVAITENLLGPEHFEVATSLNNLADLYCQQEDYARALPLCQRALSIRQKVLGQDHPDLTDSLITLAQILRGLANDHEALAACQRSLAIADRTLDPNHPLVADALFAMGGIYSDLGEYSEALSAYQRALALDEKISGPDHPAVIEVLNELSALFGRRLDWEQSLSTSVELSKRQRRYFVGQTLALSDLDALRSMQSSFQSAEFIHSVCAQVPAGRSEATWRAGAQDLALRKAFLEEVRAAQAALEAAPGTAMRALREQYRAAQVQLSRLSKSRLGPDDRDSRRNDLEGELRQIEQQLSEQSAVLAQTLRDRNLALNDIARNLPPGSALADFTQYRRYDFAAKGTNQWKEQHYAAYLTFPLERNSTNILVERVDLGEAAPIDEAVDLVCRRMSAGQYAARDLAPTLQRLSDMVYAPLAKYLTNVPHLIVCPDGQLSRVPFEMLSHDGRFLIEEKTISYVGSGREIVRLQSGTSVSPDSNPAATGTNAPGRAGRPPYVGPALVMGGPDFDLDLAKARSRPSSRSGRTVAPGSQSPTFSPQPGTNQSLLTAAVAGALSRDYRGVKFPPLPGAEAEARSVAKLLGGDTVLRVGADAREAELKAVVSPRVLHLATHGFYLSDQEFRQTNSLLSRLPGDWAQAGRPPYANNDWENPLLRCGIALAGANHASQITNAVAEDGVLTGLEASLLNLQGTELVILSACDSGSGEVKIGEGVMSLRRAFRIAGAETVMASHWKVNDRATRELMTEFIQRWRSGEPRATAWREAQLSLLHSKEFSNPFFWAAFTLTGQWK